MKISRLRISFIASLLFCITFFTTNVSGDITSQISDKVLNLKESPHAYSFIISGHAYGTPSGSLYPAASLLGNIQLFNSLKPDFMMLLGDAIQHQGAGNGIGKLEIEIFKKSLVDKLDFPIFNSPGNHDLSIRNLYEKYFGKTFFHFQQSSELYIVLDTQLGPGLSDRPQRDYVLNLIKSAKQDNGIKNIFVFMHTTLWAVNNSPLNSINPWVNGPMSGSNDFEKIILPELNLLAQEKNVYLFSGDIGLKNYQLGKFPQESFPLFYQKHNNITYIANGLAENENDAVIKVDVSIDGDVAFYPISLIGNEIGNIDQYGIEYWQNKFAISESANTVEVKVDMTTKVYKKIKKIMKSKNFILGNVFLLFLAFIYIVFLRYRLAKK
jgi:hypothetical protein